MSSLRYSDDRVPRRSPIRLVCTVPAYMKKPPGTKQAWAHIFDDSSQPYRNWVDCRWVCDRPIRIAGFRYLPDPRRFAILHPSTKPKGLGVVPRWEEGYTGTMDVVPDSRVESEGGWQLSFFDDLGASGDVWGSSPDDVLLRAFGKHGFHSAYDARDWKLETVIDASGVRYGAGV